MDEILSRKTAAPSAADSLTAQLSALWAKLKSQLESDIKVWNLKCEQFDVPDSKLIFYGNPAPVISELGKASKSLSKTIYSAPIAELEFSSIYAETFQRTFLGLPKKRVYVWLTQTEHPRILFNYGVACSYNSASQLPITFEDGQLVLGDREEPNAFLAETARELLRPLFEVR